MSLSFQPVTPVCVRDPRTMIENHREYAVLKSGSQTTWKAFTTTSIANSALQFSCPPPSGNVIVDRKMYVYIPVRLAFTAQPPIGSAVLNPSYDAPRAFPISSSIETLSATINNQSVNINMADVIQALMRYNTDTDLLNGDYSGTPTYLDQSQSYADLIASTRSPLGNYSNNSDGARMSRGAFPFYVVQNPVQTGTDVLTAYVDCCFCEPIFVSPFYFGKSNGCGFYNINTLDFNFTFLGQTANRMWSHHDMAGTNVITSSAHYFFGQGNIPGPALTTFPTNQGQQPQILMQFITPQETQIIPTNMPITYPYFDTIRFPTNLPQAVARTAFGFNSNNIQLNSVPRRMYIYIRKQNSDLYANASNTDTFFQINSLSIQFLNSSGLLASASMNQLYNMSKKNHCNMSWTQFSGGLTNAAVAAFAGTKIGTVGSVVCIEFATDLGLPSLMAPGILSQCQLQISGVATNLSTVAINPTLYIVPILEGTFTVQSMGQCSTQVGVITPQDILSCQERPAINYKDVENVNGGDFWSGLVNFGSKLFPFLRDNKIISTVSGMIPHPIAQGISTAAKAVGFGMDGMMASGEDGGVLLGGRRLHRQNLRKNMSKY